jgi:hypothetical protein
MLSEKVLDQIKVSPSFPTLSEPVSTQVKKDVPLKEPLVFSWKGDSPDKLRFYVQISSNKGKTWITIAVGLLKPEVTITPEQVKGFSNLTVRVIAHDRFHSAASKSKTIELPAVKQ